MVPPPLGCGGKEGGGEPLRDRVLLVTQDWNGRTVSFRAPAVPRHCSFCADRRLQVLLDAMPRPFGASEVKCLMLQLLEGVRHMHANWVLHRDLKTSNLLMDNKGGVKICDFGLARHYGDPLRPYTQPVVTLWYR